MENKYKTSLEIPCYFFDRDSRLRPAGFMDLAQDLATKGARQIGVTDAVLRPYGLVWILARMHVYFARLPHFGDCVDLETWHRGLDGLACNRDYRMLFPDGSLSVAATSAWVFMDIQERRVVRPDQMPVLQRLGVQNPEKATAGSAPKIVPPRNLSFTLAGMHKVCYSDVDYNGHVNNARYPVWAMDVLPFDFVAGRLLREMSINFNREAHPGECVELYGASSDEAWYVEGRIADRQVFICKLVF